MPDAENFYPHMRFRAREKGKFMDLIAKTHLKSVNYESKSNLQLIDIIIKYFDKHNKTNTLAHMVANLLRDRIIADEYGKSNAELSKRDYGSIIAQKNEVDEAEIKILSGMCSAYRDVIRLLKDDSPSVKPITKT